MKLAREEVQQLLAEAAECTRARVSAEFAESGEPSCVVSVQFVRLADARKFCEQVTEDGGVINDPGYDDIPILTARIVEGDQPDSDIDRYGVAYRYGDPRGGEPAWLDPQRMTVYHAPREEISREKLARKLFERRTRDADLCACVSWDVLDDTGRSGWLRSADDVIRLIGSGELP